MLHLDPSIAIAAGFLCGSIPFGIFVGMLFGVANLRNVGSGNIGATNVVRAAGWKAGVLTFLLDFLKGLLPMLFINDSSIWIGLAAVIGHCWSPWLKFKGGKGVSTTFGVLFALDWRIGLGCAVSYGLLLAVTRVSAIGSLFAMLSALFSVIILRESNAEIFAMILIVVAVLYRHKANWEQLLKGTAAAALAFALLSPKPASAFLVTDARNKQIETGDAKRIAALMPNLAESIIGLGAGSRLIAAPEYTNIPSGDLGHVKQLGPYPRLSPEIIHSVNPDLVIANIDGNDRALVEKLEELGLRVLVLDTRSILTIKKTMSVLAKIAGAEKNADYIKFNQKFAKPVAASSTSPLIFVQVGWKPLVGAGHGSFIEDVLGAAGTRNVLADVKESYPRTSPEEIVKRDPDYIVICPMGENSSDVKDALSFWNRFPNLKAVKNHHIHIMAVGRLTKPGFNLVAAADDLRKLTQ